MRTITVGCIVMALNIAAATVAAQTGRVSSGDAAVSRAAGWTSRQVGSATVWYPPFWAIAFDTGGGVSVAPAEFIQTLPSGQKQYRFGVEWFTTDRTDAVGMVEALAAKYGEPVRGPFYSTGASGLRAFSMRIGGYHAAQAVFSDVNNPGGLWDVRLVDLPGLDELFVVRITGTSADFERHRATIDAMLNRVSFAIAPAASNESWGVEFYGVTGEPFTLVFGPITQGPKGFQRRYKIVARRGILEGVATIDQDRENVARQFRNVRMYFGYQECWVDRKDNRSSGLPVTLAINCGAGDVPALPPVTLTEQPR